jgi:hypothetical protein
VPIGELDCGDCVAVVTTVPLEPGGCVDCVPVSEIDEVLVCEEKETGGSVEVGVGDCDTGG